jgi:hypothetical protein
LKGSVLFIKLQGVCSTTLLFSLYRELEYNLLVGQLLVHSCESVELSLNINLVLGVKVDLKNLATIQTAASTLADNFGGVYKIVKDGFLNRGKGATAGAGTRGFRGTGETSSKDGSLRDDHYVTPTV